MGSWQWIQDLLLLAPPRTPIPKRQFSGSSRTNLRNRLSDQSSDTYSLPPSLQLEFHDCLLSPESKSLDQTSSYLVIVPVLLTSLVNVCQLRTSQSELEEQGSLKRIQWSNILLPSMMHALVGELKHKQSCCILKVGWQDTNSFIQVWKLWILPRVSEMLNCPVLLHYVYSFI